MSFSKEVIKQSTLLLDIMPFFLKKECFALHGGTALNFFILNMPRLSIDIDLTYLPIHEPFGQGVHQINKALTEIAKEIQTEMPNVRIQKKYKSSKLIIEQQGTRIKIEPNRSMRGTISKPEVLSLSPKAKAFFKKDIHMRCCPKEQVFGGKFSAALSRKLVRDLFDVHQIFQHTSFNEKIKEGFFYAILSNNNSIANHFLIPIEHRRNPIRKEIAGLFESPLVEKQYQETFEQLLNTLLSALTEKDKQFLLDFKQGNRLNRFDWLGYPSILWKQQHVMLLKKERPSSYQKLLNRLKTAIHADAPNHSVDPLAPRNIDY